MRILSDMIAVTDQDQQGIMLTVQYDWSDNPENTWWVDPATRTLYLKLTAEEAVELKNWLA